MDLGQELRLFDAKSTPSCWRKVCTNAPGRGSTVTDRVRTLRQKGAEGQGDRKGRKGGMSQRGAPHSERETGTQFLWMDIGARPQVGTKRPLGKQVTSQDKVW